MGAEAAAATRQRLGGLLQGCTRGAPFTLQRFAELLLAPSRQYSSFVKLVRGLRGV
jgi:PPP4R2